MLRRVVAVLTFGVAIMVIAACGQAAAVADSPTERTIYMAAVEPKGGQQVDVEPMPPAVPPGGGYVLKEPNDEGRWEVSTYRWAPGTIVVNEGDIVTLEVIGINGKDHPLIIEEFGVDELVTRGHITTVTFTADKAGFYKIVCSAHLPSMQADLVVLPIN
jgi:hypothetical protein